MQILVWSWTSSFLLSFILFVKGIYCKDIFHNEEFCEKYRGTRTMVKPGEIKEIQFEKFEVHADFNITSSNQICRTEFVTWRDCHFVITFINTNIPHCSTNGICRCDYVGVQQPEYKKSYMEFCGKFVNSSVSYESKTKLVAVDFVYKSSYAGIFSVQIQPLKNIYTIKGHHSRHNFNSTGYLESPFFPYVYPTDYSAKYVLISDDPKGFIQLVFTDFLLSQWSEVLVFDTNGSQIGLFNGNTFRPPVIYSSGRNLTVKFEANGEYPNLGFRVMFNFINYIGKFMMSKPVTDCGGLLEDSGGVIKVKNMVEGLHSQLFDCIWIIRLSTNYGTHLSLQVSLFEDVVSNPVLKIRKGVTSKSPLIATLKLTDSQSDFGPQNQEFVIPLVNGFYIRLQGYFNNKSRVEMIYTAFRYETSARRDYRCLNGRYIDPILRCDGANHCGDFSDEGCYKVEATVPSEDGTWWRTLTPNYYFPKQDSSGTGTNTLILITSLAGLGMFIITTTLILIKLHKQRREESTVHQALNTISQEVDNHSHVFQHPIEPPLYDPPPSYDDVIKFYLAPPPTYNSVTSTDAESCSGIENAAFVPDTEPLQPAVQPPSLLTLIMFPPAISRSNSATSEKRVIQCSDSSINQTDSVESLASSLTESGVQSPETATSDITNDCGNSLTCDSDFSCECKLQEAHKQCSCEGACPCPLNDNATVPAESEPEGRSFPSKVEILTGEEVSVMEVSSNADDSSQA